ncbi:unnamed protein product [Clavelina lepadiformis]|uniref:Uncharacterized protein n=1 Tax=Clavelina lepadiformis TaxID=159417 RepID=A0ABP0GMF8_CLALP
MNVSFAITLAFVATLSTLTISIVCEATADWAHSTIDSSSTGLWQFCFQKRCVFYSEIASVAAYIQAVRAFSVMSIILQGGAIFALLYACLDSKCHFRTSSIFLLCAGFLMLVAMSIFTGKYERDTGVVFGYSFILGWISTTACFLVSCCLCVVKRDDYSYSPDNS